MGLEQNGDLINALVATEFQEQPGEITPIAQLVRRPGDYISYPHYLQIEAANVGLRVMHALTLPMEEIYRLVKLEPGKTTLTEEQLITIQHAIASLMEEGAYPQQVLKQVREMYRQGQAMPIRERREIIREAHALSSFIYNQYLGKAPPEKEIKISDSTPKHGIIDSTQFVMKLLDCWVHDARTPMTSIKGFAQLIKVIRTRHQQGQYTQQQATDEEATITEQLLVWASESNHSPRLIRESFFYAHRNISASQFFELLWNEFYPEDPETGVHQLSFLLGPDWTVHWEQTSNVSQSDQLQFYLPLVLQIALNIIHNAFKSQASLEFERQQLEDNPQADKDHRAAIHTPTLVVDKQGLRYESNTKVLDISAGVKTNERSGRRHIEVIFKDRASGIRDENGKLITTPGYRVDFAKGHSRWVAASGNGQGMYLIRDILKCLNPGSDLALYTRDDGQRGAQVVLRIPLV